MPDFNLEDALPGLGISPPANTDPSSGGSVDLDQLLSSLGYANQQSPAPVAPAVPTTPVSDKFAAPVTSPEQVPEGGPDNVPGAPAPGLPVNSKLALGAKTSVSGYNPASMTAIQKGPQTALDKSISGDRAAVQAQYDPLTAKYDKAGEDAQAAALAESNAESQKILATSTAKQKIAEANKNFLTQEQAAVDNARAESAAGIANYRAALADYAAAKVNPAQLWESAGQGGQFMMLATAFTHDFLAAKNIQSSGLDAIHNSIKENINAQIQNIQHKGEVAQGFKQLWDMQRSQSATDAEARQRMNGFYLAALSNQIEANLGQYDSQLALTKGQAIKAKLMEEQVKNDLLVQQHIDQSSNQRATNRIQVYSANLSAASSKYSADAHIAAAQIAANAKGLTSPLAGVIFDTSKSGGNKAIRRLLPDMSKEDVKKYRDQAANTMNTVKNVETLIDLQDQIDKIPPGDIGAINRLQEEKARVAELVRNVTKMSIIYDNSGKQINEQEVALYDGIVGKKDWFLNGDNIRTLGTLAKMSLDKENNILAGASTEILPGDPAYGAKSGDAGLDPGNQALTDIQSSVGAGRHANTPTEDAIKRIQSPHAFDDPGLIDRAKSYVGVGEEPELLSHYKSYAKAFPDEAGKGPSQAFKAVDDIAQQAIAGNQVAKAQLDAMAAKATPASQSQDDYHNASLLQHYAQWELSLFPMAH